MTVDAAAADVGEESYRRFVIQLSSHTFLWYAPGNVWLSPRWRAGRRRWPRRVSRTVIKAARLMAFCPVFLPFSFLFCSAIKRCGRRRRPKGLSCTSAPFSTRHLSDLRVLPSGRHTTVKDSRTRTQPYAGTEASCKFMCLTHTAS